MKLSELAQALELKQFGSDPDIKGLLPVESAGAQDLSFVIGRKWLAQASKASAVIIPADLVEAVEPGMSGLISSSPALDAGRAAELLGYRAFRVAAGVHPSAVVDPTAELGQDVAIGPGVIIGAEVRIGQGTMIHAGAAILDRCSIGARCLIQANAVIGSDGFGLEFVDGKPEQIPHFGTVRIEDDVEVGACTTIDRARFGETVIGAGSKIDNQVQIAHNVQIGKRCIIVGQVGIAGSCIIGDDVVLAGQAGVVPHVTIGQGARIAASTGVAGDVPAGATWSGWMGQPHRDNMSQIALIRKLPMFMEMVRNFIKYHK